MAKLTKKARQQAIIDLQQRIVKAIEEAPRGLTDCEICYCIIAATAVTGVAR